MLSLNLLIIFFTILYIAWKIRRLVKVLNLGKQEEYKGTIKGVIRCLLGMGRTFNHYDVGFAYMILMVLGFLFILMKFFSQQVTTDLIIISVLTGYMTVFVTILCSMTLLSLVIRRFKNSYSMELLPLIALLAFCLIQFIDAHPMAAMFSNTASFYFIIIFVATSFPHAFASILNIYYQKRTPIGWIRPISLKDDRCGANNITDLSWKNLLDAQACANCGRCESRCPAFISGKHLSPRKVIRDVLEQTNNHLNQNEFLDLQAPISKEEIWSCSFCMVCVSNCPVYINHVDIVIDQRRLQVMNQNTIPLLTRKMLRDLELYGDVMGKGAANRSDWSRNRNIMQVSKANPEADVLLWAGCFGAFHPRYRKTLQAMATVLKSGGINFKILGTQELCCGDPARRLGKEDLFQELATENIKCLNRYGIKDIVTLCPHCYNTLKNEYPDFGGKFRIQHASEMIADLIRQGQIKMKYPLKEKQITVHDPCYLGRTNGIYQPLRDICQSLPEIRFHELSHNKKQAFCCGGGGGQMWLPSIQGNNINKIRADEINASNAEVVVTACPYCQTMIEDGLNGLETKTTIKTLDLVDIVALSIEQTSNYT